MRVGLSQALSFIPWPLQGQTGSWEDKVKKVMLVALGVLGSAGSLTLLPWPWSLLACGGIMAFVAYRLFSQREVSPQRGIVRPSPWYAPFRSVVQWIPDLLGNLQPVAQPGLRVPVGEGRIRTQQPVFRPVNSTIPQTRAVTFLPQQAHQQEERVPVGHGHRDPTASPQQTERTISLVRATDPLPQHQQRERVPVGHRHRDPTASPQQTERTISLVRAADPLPQHQQRERVPVGHRHRDPTASPQQTGRTITVSSNPPPPPATSQNQNLRSPPLVPSQNLGSPNPRRRVPVGHGHTHR